MGIGIVIGFFLLQALILLPGHLPFGLNLLLLIMLILRFKKSSQSFGMTNRWLNLLCLFHTTININKNILDKDFHCQFTSLWSVLNNLLVSG